MISNYFGFNVIVKLKTIHMSALTMQKCLETGRTKFIYKYGHSMGRIFFCKCQIVSLIRSLYRQCHHVHEAAICQLYLHTKLCTGYSAVKHYGEIDPSHYTCIVFILLIVLLLLSKLDLISWLWLFLIRLHFLLLKVVII